MDDEREPPEGLIDVLEMNLNENIQNLYGPYHKVIAAIRLGKKEGIVIGGIVFSVFTSQLHTEARIPASVQVSYVFVEAKYRGVVSMREIVDYCQKTAIDLYGNRTRQ